MDKFVIKGGAALQGEIPVGGSKNSALPALAAALLTEEPVTLRRVPAVRDIRTMQRLLVDIGSQVDVDGETVRLETPTIVCAEAPHQPAHFRLGTTGRADQSGAWLYRGRGAGRVERRGGPLRPHHRHGHRRP